MIKSASELESRKIEIDLRGKEGNAMYLLGMVEVLGKQLSWSRKSIEIVRNTMMLGDYNSLLEIFDNHFGEFVVLYR